MSDLWQPGFSSWPWVDGPLYTQLRDSPNHSAWLYDALEVFLAAWGDTLDGEVYHFRTCLRRDRDQDLVTFLEPMRPLHRQKVLRAAAWYKFGRSSVGLIDVGVLANKLAAELRARNMLLKGPAEQVTDDLAQELEDAIGQFLA